MQTFLNILLVITFPWMVFLNEDEPGKAFVTFMMQASLLFWLFASIWAWKELKKNTKVGQPNDSNPS